MRGVERWDKHVLCERDLIEKASLPSFLAKVGATGKRPSSGFDARLGARCPAIPVQVREMRAQKTGEGGNKSECFVPMSEQIIPMPEQIIPMSKQMIPMSEQIIPMSERIIPMPERIVSMPEWSIPKSQSSVRSRDEGARLEKGSVCQECEKCGPAQANLPPALLLLPRTRRPPASGRPREAGCA